MQNDEDSEEENRPIKRARKMVAEKLQTNLEKLHVYPIHFLEDLLATLLQKEIFDPASLMRMDEQKFQRFCSLANMDEVIISKIMLLRESISYASIEPSAIITLAASSDDSSECSRSPKKLHGQKDWTINRLTSVTNGWNEKKKQAIRFKENDVNYVLIHKSLRPVLLTSFSQADGVHQFLALCLSASISTKYFEAQKKKSD